jgi:hypothetical protein
VEVLEGRLIGKHTQRTLKYLRDEGHTTAFVEKYVWPVKKKFDMFGIIDIVAIKPGETTGVQSCGPDFASHDQTILEHENSLKWLKAGNRLVLIGWNKVLKVRGGKAKVWKVRIKEYKVNDFQARENDE